MKSALASLLIEHPDRARKVLETLSDPTIEPIPSAVVQGATGAWSG
jgi:hypothetical protein